MSLMVKKAKAIRFKFFVPVIVIVLLVMLFGCTQTNTPNNTTQPNNAYTQPNANPSETPPIQQPSADNGLTGLNPPANTSAANNNYCELKTVSSITWNWTFTQYTGENLYTNTNTNNTTDTVIVGYDETGKASSYSHSGASTELDSSNVDSFEAQLGITKMGLVDCATPVIFGYKLIQSTNQEGTWVNTGSEWQKYSKSGNILILETRGISEKMFPTDPNELSYTYTEMDFDTGFTQKFVSLHYNDPSVTSIDQIDKVTSIEDLYNAHKTSDNSTYEINNFTYQKR